MPALQRDCAKSIRGSKKGWGSFTVLHVYFSPAILSNRLNNYRKSESLRQLKLLEKTTVPSLHQCFIHVDVRRFFEAAVRLTQGEILYFCLSKPAIYISHNATELWTVLSNTNCCLFGVGKLIMDISRFSMLAKMPDKNTQHSLFKYKHSNKMPTNNIVCHWDRGANN